MKLTLIPTFLVALLSVAFSAPVLAAPDLANGKAIDQQKCYNCHAKKTGFGNGDMIYTRADGKVKSMADLKKMVS